MRRILLYIILIIILFSAFNQLKEIWRNNNQSLDATYSQVKEGVFGWYQKASDTTKELKEKLNKKVKEASEKYQTIKKELEEINAKINEKKEQLNTSIKEIEDAKKALDKLLEKQKIEEQKITTPLETQDQNKTETKSQ